MIRAAFNVTKETKYFTDEDPLRMSTVFLSAQLYSRVCHDTFLWSVPAAEDFSLSFVHQNCRERSIPRMRTEEVYRKLYAELEKYEQEGVDIRIDGYHASPMQIVTAYMIKEEGTYMRDYVMDPEGNIERLSFTNINHYGQAEITP